MPKSQSSKFVFEPLNESHFGLMLDWFNKPHVQAFYSLREWTYQQVCDKLTPHLHGKKKVHGYVISLWKCPIGYIQSYPIQDYPWENQELPNEMIQEAAGIDLFIGEAEYSGQGLGCQIVDCFLYEHIWPYFRYCLVDPDIKNRASMRLFQKCGFIEHKQIETTNALNEHVTLQLFIKERPAL